MLQIHKNDIIKQLVAQQFFQQPDFVVDRTHRIRVKVSNSGGLFDKFCNYLLDKSQNLEGLDLDKYLEVLFQTGERLSLDRNILRKHFLEKSESFISENLATEDLLFISMISTLLEVLDLVHYNKSIKEIRKAFAKHCDTILTDIDQKKVFEEGIKRLGEVADSNFSIIHNLIKVFDLGKIFSVKIWIDHESCDSFMRKVIEKIITGCY
ncbi:MAG: hypothetical protein ACTSW1_19010 [Candidatus Hodarchaeales archaeon]